MLQRKKMILIAILLLTIAILFPYKSLRHFINPHYIDNKDITVDSELFSPDSSASVLYYTLDIGARGLANYQSIIRHRNYSENIMENNLPPQLIVLGWTNNNTLSVQYNPNMALALGGGDTDLNLKKDTLERNGVLIIIKERIRENRDSVFNISLPK